MSSKDQEDGLLLQSAFTAVGSKRTNVECAYVFYEISHGIIGWGIVACPVIQAIERPDFEDGLRTGTTVEVITDTHSIRTNPEASVRLMAGVADAQLYAESLKTQSLQLLDQFVSKSTPAMFRSTLGINLLL